MDASWRRDLQWIDLADWRKETARSYCRRDEALDAGGDPKKTWESWKARKNDFFKAHPQSPLSDFSRLAFKGLRYFPYDGEWRMQARLVPMLDDALAFGETAPPGLRFRKAARLEFELGGQDVSLIVYWIDVYGGSLFLPFRDATGDDSTYGGGRYLVDTAKGSDFYYLEGSKDRVVVDFNYAYNPSCAYDERWSCPLAPRENYLAQAVRAGELRFASD